MTDPIDHSARTREIEARLAGAFASGTPLIAMQPADLRYLLDRVRAQSERIETLEVALGEAWFDGDTASCTVCEQPIRFDRGGILEHKPDCIVLTLPAPETEEPAP